MDTKPNNHSNASEEWEPCAPGELERLANRLENGKRRKTRKRIYAATLATTALFAGVILVTGSMWGRVGFRYGGISCNECYSNFDAYNDHITEAQLLANAELVESMRLHLKKCVLCRGKFESRYPGSLSYDLSATKRPLLVAFIPNFSHSTRLCY